MEQNEKNQLLDLLLGSIASEAKDFAKDEISKMKKEVETELSNMKSSAEMLKNDIESVLQNCPKVVCLGTPEKPKKEMTHKAFDTVVKILTSAKRKEKNIMLVGGAGGGKTHLCSQVAKALGIEFYPMSVGMQTTKSDLMGFVNATGGYVTSPVRKAYEEGGLLLLDEFDAAHAGVVTILNSLLANGHASFPDKIVTKNEKFVCLVACNTYGTGANMDYVGRNRLDGATLDRFLTVDISYDKKMERKLTKNDTWFDVVQKVRKNIDKFGIKKIVSPRASMDGADLLDAGFDVKEVVDMVLLKGCDEDVKEKMLRDVDLTQVKPEHEENDVDNEVCDIVLSLIGKSFECRVADSIPLKQFGLRDKERIEKVRLIDFDKVWTENGLIGEASNAETVKIKKGVNKVSDVAACRICELLSRLNNDNYILTPESDSIVRGKKIKVVVDSSVSGKEISFVKVVELKDA